MQQLMNELDFSLQGDARDTENGAHPDDKEQKLRKGYVQPIRDAFQPLNDKAAYFFNKVIEHDNKPQLKKKYSDAYAAINNILDALQIATNQYICGQLSPTAYKARAKDILDCDSFDANVLKEHRGCKKMLANLLAGILGNVFYLIAAACVGRFMLFEPKTDSATKLTTIRDEVNKFGENPVLG